MVFTSVIYVNTWIVTHLPTPEGWKAELLLLLLLLLLVVVVVRGVISVFQLA